MEKKRVTVLVAGQKFTILTEESEKYVLDLAAKIDARISALSIASDLSRERASVLCALDLADDYEKSKEAMNEIKEQIKDYISDLSSLREENAALKKELDEIKKAASEKKIEPEKKPEPVKKEAQPEPKAEPVTEQKEITAEDDLLFEVPEDIKAEESPKAAPQKSKKKHEHNHVNPYKQQFIKKQTDRGYTPQRQYSLFDNDEE